MPSHVFHRAADASPPVAVAGQGLYITDKAGKQYIDASGGPAVSCLGHGHPAVARAIRDQLDKIAYASTAFFTTEAMEALADNLVAHAPPGIGYVYFVTGGSEGVEAALKMARQYFLEIGQPERRRIISRRQSYHGNTLGALAVSGNVARRKPYGPLLFEGHQIAPCYAYRGRHHDETEEAYGLRVAGELEAEIERLGPGTVAAFIAETVVGATLGAVPAVPGYFRRVREICDRHGVLLILDEVMSGMGRTGTLHACEQEWVSPDIMVVAKGLGGGYQPIGALLVSERVYNAFRDGSGGFVHGHTFMGHAMGCAAALAVQKVIEEEDLLANVRRQGARLQAALQERFGNHRHVGDIRGRGLFWGLELVADRATKTPFDPALGLNVRVKNEALRQGLCFYPTGGTADGRAGDHIIIAPPYVVTAEEIDLIVDRAALAIDATLAGLPR